ncbi:unnamed protein product [marine sediment metagenome]|uniref:Uncharacterized protein n=1 Tax=marine sediment metagenome TaxID=412755 RepID=X1SN17_9ZZZZ
MQTQIMPGIRIGPVFFDGGGAPVFDYGTTHIAHAQMTNPTPAAFTYNAELYLGPGKVATSGSVPFTLSAGQSKVVDFAITMPDVEGTWPVLLDVFVGVDLIAAYQATEDVSVVITPDIDIGPITWD